MASAILCGLAVKSVEDHAWPALSVTRVMFTQQSPRSHGLLYPSLTLVVVNCAEVSHCVCVTVMAALAAPGWESRRRQLFSSCAQAAELACARPQTSTCVCAVLPWIDCSCAGKVWCTDTRTHTQPSMCSWLKDAMEGRVAWQQNSHSEIRASQACKVDTLKICPLHSCEGHTKWF